MNSSHDDSDHRVAGNTASRYVAMAVTMVISLLLTPFLIRSVGKPAYGLQSLSHQALDFVTLAAAAVAISFDRLAAAHYARRDFDRMNATLSAGLTLSIVVSVGVVLLTALTASFAGTLFDLPAELVPTARWVLLIFGAAAACYIVNAVYRSPVFITNRLYLDSFGNMMAVMGAASLVVPLFVFGRPSIVTWVALSVGARLAAQWFFIIPLARRGLGRLRIRLFAPGSRAAMRGLASFSGLSLIGGLGTLLYHATDSIMISNLDELGIAQVANYNVAQRWYPQLHMIAAGFVGVLGPYMTAQAAVGNRDGLRGTVTRAVRHCYIILAYPCLLLTIYAEPFLRHWLTDAFVMESVPVMRLVMVSLLVGGVGIVSQETLYACHRIKRLVVVTLIGGVLNVPLSIVLVKYAGLGLTGIAVGSLVSLFLRDALCSPFLLCRVLSLRCPLLLRGMLRALAGALPLVAACLLVRRLWTPGGLPGLLDQFVLCGLAYAPSVWFISLTGDDRGALRRHMRAGMAWCRRAGSHWRERRSRQEDDHAGGGGPEGMP